MKKLLLLTFTLINLSSFCQNIKLIDLKSLLGNIEGAISIYDLKTDQYFRYNPEQCEKRFSPCSTFKIPNSLIGLETQVIPDSGFVIKYDSLLHPKDPVALTQEPFKYWFQDLSLKRALKYSCVWYYQELARRVGQDRMKRYVSNLNYGNKDISAGIDTFWLCTSLKISINEQIEFLKKLYLHKLNGFSEKNMETVKAILPAESTPKYKLYGKTGSGIYPDKAIGWYVGFLETESGIKIFAMNFFLKNFEELRKVPRVELTKKILKELKFIQ